MEQSYQFFLEIVKDPYIVNPSCLGKWKILVLILFTPNLPQILFAP